MKLQLLKGLSAGLSSSPGGLGGLGASSRAKSILAGSWLFKLGSSGLYTEDERLRFALASGPLSWADAVRVAAALGKGWMVPSVAMMELFFLDEGLKDDLTDRVMRRLEAPLRRADLEVWTADISRPGTAKSFHLFHGLVVETQADEIFPVLFVRREP